MKPIQPTSQHAILMTFDTKYLEYGIACLHSIIANYPNYPDIHVSYEGDHPEDWDRILCFDRVYRIDFSDADARIEGLDYGLVGSKQVYMRFYAWSTVFELYDKVMYLDADCLVLNPLDHMFEHEEFYIIKDLMTKAADCWVFKLEYEMDPELNALLDSDGLTYQEMQYRMCNAGIFVIPKHYRTVAYANQLWEIANQYNTYLKLGDQSVISIWCAIQGIEAQLHFENNLQTAGLFYFNTDIPIEDLKNYPVSEEALKIFHFSYLKPHTPILERYRANYTLYYESFKKYQYYKHMLPSVVERPEQIDLHDMAIVWIIQSDKEDMALKERKYLLTYLEKTYTAHEMIVVEYGETPQYQAAFGSRKQLRYHFFDTSHDFSEPQLFNVSMNLANRQKVWLFNGFSVPHPKAVLESSKVLEESVAMTLPHHDEVYPIDLAQFKKKRGNLKLFPYPYNKDTDEAVYALQAPDKDRVVDDNGFCVVLDRLQCNLSGMLTVKAASVRIALDQLAQQYTDQTIPVTRIPFPLYAFHRSTMEVTKSSSL